MLEVFYESEIIDMAEQCNDWKELANVCYCYNEFIFYEKEDWETLEEQIKTVYITLLEG